jgi:hypothetical protein
VDCSFSLRSLYAAIVQSVDVFLDVSQEAFPSLSLFVMVRFKSLTDQFVTPVRPLQVVNDGIAVWMLKSSFDPALLALPNFPSLLDQRFSGISCGYFGSTLY